MPVYVIGTGVPPPGGAHHAISEIEPDEPRRGAQHSGGPPRVLSLPLSQRSAVPRHRHRRAAGASNSATRTSSCMTVRAPRGFPPCSRNRRTPPRGAFHRLPGPAAPARVGRGPVRYPESGTGADLSVAGGALRPRPDCERPFSRLRPPRPLCGDGTGNAGGRKPLAELLPGNTRSSAARAALLVFGPHPILLGPAGTNGGGRAPRRDFDRADRAHHAVPPAPANLRDLRRQAAGAAANWSFLLSVAGSRTTAMPPPGRRTGLESRCASLRQRP